MILAAGRGSRLRPLTDRTPKPLLAINGEPLLRHQLRWLRRAGVREVVINLCHLGEQIEAAVGDGRELGLRVRYSREVEALDTGGGVKKALPYLLPGPFVVLNGDIWTDYPFERLVDVRPARAHLVLTAKPRHRPGADFHLRDGRVRRDPRQDDLTFCGIAVLAEALFQDAPDGAFSLRELYFRAAAAGALSGERFDGDWVDIGTPEQLRRARALDASSSEVLHK